MEAKKRKMEPRVRAYNWNAGWESMNGSVARHSYFKMFVVHFGLRRLLLLLSYASLDLNMEFVCVGKHLDFRIVCYRAYNERQRAVSSYNIH